MTEHNRPSDRERWNERYRQGAYAERLHPGAYLVERLALLAGEIGDKPLTALDVASGRGRHAIHLAQLGYAVDAVDVSDVGLAETARRADEMGLRIQPCQQDLMQEPIISSGPYDLIVMFRFVAPQVLAQLPLSLRVNGSLIVEEHLLHENLVPDQVDEPIIGPGSARFRVAPGALTELVRNWNHDTIQLSQLHAFEGLVREPDGSLAALSRLHVKRVN